MMDLVKTNFKTAIERLRSFPSDQLNKSHGGHIGVPDKRV
jgi:hypothetical protein